MSHHDYEISKKIAAQDYSFYALVMAALRKADATNTAALNRAFPGLSAELIARYNAPGGFLPGETAPTPEPADEVADDDLPF